MVRTIASYGIPAVGCANMDRAPATRAE